MKPGSLRPDLRELAWVTTWKLGTLGICRDYKGPWESFLQILGSGVWGLGCQGFLKNSYMVWYFPPGALEDEIGFKNLSKCQTKLR